MERRSGLGGWLKCAILGASETFYQMNDLLDGHSYEFQVIAENKVGSSKGSMTSPIIARDPWMKASAPGTPKISDVTKRSAHVTWTAPNDDGGDDIRNYVVEYRVLGTFRYSRANEGDRTTQTSYKVWTPESWIMIQSIYK